MTLENHVQPVQLTQLLTLSLIQISTVTKIAGKLFTDDGESNLGMKFTPKNDVLVGG